MNKNIFFAFLLTVSMGLAQRSIQSTVLRKVAHAPELATVRLLNAADSALVQGAQTNAKAGLTYTCSPGNIF